MFDRCATSPRHPAVALAVALACCCSNAMADSRPWYVGASQRLAYESNLYRIDSSTALGNLSRSDTLSSTSLVAGLDQPLGRQRLYGNATLSVNRYSHNDYLNANSYSLAGGLDWATIDRISGNLSMVASRNQRSFNLDSGPERLETRKNDESLAQIDTTVRVGVVTRLTMEATLGYRSVGYSAPEYAGSQYQQSRASLGLRYRPGIATLGASLSLADSRYENSPLQAATGQAAEKLRRSSLDFTADWPVSGSSSVYARLSPTRAAYDQFTQRDFSGLTGALKWNWLPTGKLSVETRLVHDISQDSNFETFGGPVVIGTSNTDRTATELRMAVGYELTAKTALNAALTASHRRLEQTANVSGLAVVTASGSDATTTLSIGARWTALRSVQLGCDVMRDQRAAQGGLSQDYRASVVSCYGRFTLQ
jgi:hypothetical protein